MKRALSTFSNKQPLLQLQDLNVNTKLAPASRFGGFSTADSLPRGCFLEEIPLIISVIDPLQQFTHLELESESSIENPEFPLPVRYGSTTVVVVCKMQRYAVLKTGPPTKRSQRLLILTPNIISNQGAPQLVLQIHKARTLDVEVQCCRQSQSI